MAILAVAVEQHFLIQACMGAPLQGRAAVWGTAGLALWILAVADVLAVGQASAAAVPRGAGEVGPQQTSAAAAVP